MEYKECKSGRYPDNFPLIRSAVVCWGFEQGGDRASVIEQCPYVEDCIRSICPEVGVKKLINKARRRRSKIEAALKGADE